MSTIPSIDLVEVDVAITIKDEVFDKDLKNKSSSRYKKQEEQVEQEVSKWEWTSSRFLESWNEEELGKVLPVELCSWEQKLFPFFGVYRYMMLSDQFRFYLKELNTFFYIFSYSWLNCSKILKDSKKLWLLDSCEFKPFSTLLAMV